MKAFICLGSEAEVVGILPIVQHEFETTGKKPLLIVKNQSASFDLSFAHKMLHAGTLTEALTKAKWFFGEAVVFPSLSDTEFPTEHRHPSHQFDQWDRADCLHLWNKLPLTLPRNAAVDDTNGPFILLACGEPDREFPFLDELHNLLVDNFPNHRVVKLPHNMIRLPEGVAIPLLDALALYDAASLIVCAETVHLQLSRACKTPVIALANDQPTAWHGSAPAARFVFYAQYTSFSEVKDALIAAAKEAIAPPAETALKPEPSVTMVYIYVAGDAQADRQAQRFVTSYLKFPPGVTHRTLIVCQGFLPEGEMMELCRKLPNCSCYVHNNSGWDIGGFITVSRSIVEDMMVCFGSSAHFRREGWLARMVDAWKKHGPGFYGSLATYEISPHINTSGFWCSPRLLSEYPLRIQNKVQRYDFEHGKNAMWKLIFKSGGKALLVTWDGEYDWPAWRQPPNIYRRGDQSNCLTFFHHNDNFDVASAETREQMSKFADTLTDAEYIHAESPAIAIETPKAMNTPKVVVVYVYPTAGGKHDEMAARFVDTYRRYPADEPHDLWVVSNGGVPTATMFKTFFGIPCQFLPNPNSLADGLDISAYRKAAREIPCDLMVFFGGNTYLVRRGWLKRMVEAYKKHGMALYGSTGNQGDANVNVSLHIRTTGFWMPPALLNAYPYPVTSETTSRYEFEHGKNGLTVWVKARGLKAWVVTWTGEFQWPHWDSIPNGFHRGDQSALLVGDRLTQPEYYSHPKQAIIQSRPPNPAVQRPPRPAIQPQRRQAIIKKR